MMADVSNSSLEESFDELTHVYSCAVEYKVLLLIRINRHKQFFTKIPHSSWLVFTKCNQPFPDMCTQRIVFKNRIFSLHSAMPIYKGMKVCCISDLYTF